MCREGQSLCKNSNLLIPFPGLFQYPILYPLLISNKLFQVAAIVLNHSIVRRWFSSIYILCLSYETKIEIYRTCTRKKILHLPKQKLGKEKWNFCSYNSTNWSFHEEYHFWHLHKRVKGWCLCLQWNGWLLSATSPLHSHHPHPFSSPRYLSPQTVSQTFWLFSPVFPHASLPSTVLPNSSSFQ